MIKLSLKTINYILKILLYQKILFLQFLQNVFFPQKSLDFSCNLIRIKYNFCTKHTKLTETLSRSKINNLNSKLP